MFDVYLSDLTNSVRPGIDLSWPPVCPLNPAQCRGFNKYRSDKSMMKYEKTMIIAGSRQNITRLIQTIDNLLLQEVGFYLSFTDI